jgi:hypothetical protein
MIKALFVIPSVVFAAVSALDPNVEVRDFDFSGLRRVQVDNNSGKVAVTPNETPRAVARVTKKKFSEKCTITMQREGNDLLHVRVDGPSYEQCEADVDVHVPKDVDVQINAGAGNVNVEGMEGKLDFRVGTGKVTGKGSFRSVQGKSGTGAVEISGISGSGNVETGSGAVNLRFTDSAKGDFNVRTGTGNVTALFPKSAHIRADLTTATGETVNELRPDSRAAFGLNMTSGTGDLKVKSY